MAYYDLSAANAALKELYDGQTVENMVYDDNPTLALLEKFTDFGGKYYPIPIISGVSQGRSSTFATAQTNQSATQVESFLLTRKTDYSIASVDNQTLKAAKSDKMAFLSSSKTVIDGAIRAITLSVASKLFRSGTGTIGQVSTSVSISTGVITLQNAADVVNFEINQTVQANATDGGTPRSALGYVIAVDRTAGTVTVASSGQGGAAATPSSWTTSDYLVTQGDNNASPSGFAAWLPLTAPGSSDNFYGVNRSVDPVRLAGVRYAGTSYPVEEALIDSLMVTAREGGRPKYHITNFGTYAAVEKALGAKVQYTEMKTGEIAFQGIKVNGGNTIITMLPDRNCPATLGYSLTMAGWKIYSLDDVPHIERYADGLEMLRIYNADAAELRCAAYYNLGCNSPGWNCVTSFGA